MNNSSYENNNHVILKGKINKLPVYSHTVMGEGFFEMFVEVQRLSEETDILPVTISERLIGDFELGDEIGICGQFRSYNKIEDGKSKLMLTIFVKELVDPNEISEINQIYLMGYICKEPVMFCLLLTERIIKVIIFHALRGEEMQGLFVILVLAKNLKFKEEFKAENIKKELMKTILKQELLMKFHFQVLWLLTVKNMQKIQLIQLVKQLECLLVKLLQKMRFKKKHLLKTNKCFFV